MKDYVSILTPCYNCEEYIGVYLEKILKQSYDYIELVIVNDGSSDRTEEIIFEYRDKIEKRGYKLNYYKQENSGVGGAIQSGLKIMTGTYFCWCDCDNFYDDSYVQKKVDIFNSNPNCNIVRSDGYMFYEGDVEHPYYRFAQNNTDLLKKRLFLNSIVEKNFHFGCAMIRTSAFDTVCSNRDIYPSRYGQNWQILLPILYYYDAYYIDEPLFFYMSRKDSITGQSHTKEKMLEMQNGHERILIETIQKMNIRDAKYYIGIIRRKYIERRIWVADTYHDEKLKEKEIQNLKRFDRILNRLQYFKLFPKYRKI